MKKYLVILFCLVGLGVSQTANALTFDLTSDHCSGGCGPAGTIFGYVELTQAGTTLDVTVHLNSPYAYAQTGAADDQAFKFNAIGVAVADITIDAHTPGLIASTGAYNGDGTGNFGFGIACNPSNSCGPGGSNPFTADITFHIANATIADLTGAGALALNGNGNYFVADVLNTSTGRTGPVDASTPGHVPDGGTTATLLGSALLGLGMLRRRFGKS